MRFAIYDKATDAYLTKMVFDVGYSDNTKFECALTEYITNAELLNTKEAATLAVANIEGFKFMEKGRFVVHSFDEELADQYIISEAGNPTNAVDNITVDLNGTIDVKYGTMPLHWSTPYLIRAITRLDALQKAAGDVYTHWNDTFDIYKVITVIDERGCTHYQFIKVTEKGLDSAKEKVKSLNKCIEELEKLNYELVEENDKLESKVESIKKEARHWKTLYENANRDREVLKNVIDNIYDDLGSTDIRKGLKETYDYVKSLSELNYIKIHNDDTDDGKPIYITAAAEFKYIIHQIIIIMESLELNQSVAFSSAEEVDRAKRLANDIIDIWEADDKFEITLKKFSQLYEAVNDPSDDDDTIMCAFKGVLEIFSSLEDHVRDIIDESVTWKNRAIKSEASLAGQKALNNANADTIERMRTAGANWKRRAEEAIRDYTKCNEALGEWKKKCRAKDADYEVLKNKLKSCEAVLDSTQDMLNITTEQRDEALEQKEFYKRQANSVYGMTVPCRCNGKQMFYDVTTGKKILVDKEKYDDLIKWLDTISFSYDTMTFINPKPTWLPLVTDYLKDLTT